MRRGLISHIALLLLLFCLTSPSYAQKKKDVEVDTVQVAFLNGFAVRADLVGAYQALFTDCGQYEVGLRVNLKDRYFPAIEVGYGIADQKDEYIEELTFKTKAPYFKVGCDFNILRNKHDDYKLFAGVRYAFTAFNYDMATENPINEEDESNDVVYTQNNGLHCSYHWLEGIMGVDAKIWGPLHLGWDVRYRRRLYQKHDEIGEPWYVPGYGGKKAAGFGANFNIIISF